MPRSRAHSPPEETSPHFIHVTCEWNLHLLIQNRTLERVRVDLDLRGIRTGAQDEETQKKQLGRVAANEIVLAGRRRYGPLLLPKRLSQSENRQLHLNTKC